MMQIIDPKNQQTPSAVSVIIPLFNEEGNIQQMHDSLVAVLTRAQLEFELIFVNDGSNDRSEEILNRLVQSNPCVVVLHLLRNKGKAAALEVGAIHARGRAIVIIDCDLQYDPNDVVRLIGELDKGFDMVSACRTNREDPKSVILTSKMFNFFVRKMTGLDFKDYFSGLKCFSREVLNYLALYGPLYRFAVVYAHVQGFRVIEVPVKHFPRLSGGSRYNAFKRLTLSIADILTVMMTVVLNPDRVYYLHLLGLFFLSIGLTLGLVNFFWPLPPVGVYATVILVSFGLYTLILKKMSGDFFDRHQREFFKRQKNLRCILQSRTQDFSTIS